MAKLHGLTMGLDVCATFHMGIPPAELRAVTTRVVERGAPAYLMAVAGNADPMLGYLTTSFREHPRLRRDSARADDVRRCSSGCRTARVRSDRESRAQLVCAATRRPAATRDVAGALEDEGRRKLARPARARLRSRRRTRSQPTRGSIAIYEHARRALYAAVDDAVIRDACRRAMSRPHRRGRSRRLPRASAGRRADPREDDARHVRHARRRRGRACRSWSRTDSTPTRSTSSSGRCCRRSGACSAMPAVTRGGDRSSSCRTAASAPAITSAALIGRRRASFTSSASARARAEHGLGVSHLRARRCRASSRWDPHLDHSCTTAVCGIHPKGKPPEAAAAEIARTVSHGSSSSGARASALTDPCGRRHMSRGASDLPLQAGEEPVHHHLRRRRRSAAGRRARSAAGLHRAVTSTMVSSPSARSAMAELPFTKPGCPALRR